MFDITSIGEVLIDFHAELSDKINMVGSLGGATCNVLTQAAKLGRSCCLIGAVGDDILGEYVIKRVKQCGVTPCITKCNETTTMAVVSLDENGDRSFDFIRKPGADSCIELNCEVRSIVESSKILEYGSLSFSKEPAASAIFDILQNSKCIKAYDPNLRANIWKDDTLMLKMALEGMKYADIVKVGEDEITAITGCDCIESSVEYLRSNCGVNNIFVTRGSKGCKYFVGKFTGEVPSYDVRACDTTGAGDSFFGAVLSRFLTHGFNDGDIVAETVRYACAAGAITASKKGTAEAMPNENEIFDLMQKN